MNEDRLIFSGSMTHMDTEQWIQIMEDHLRNNFVARKEMVQYALQYFAEGAANWWKMHEAIHDRQASITWEEFKMTLQKSHVITNTQKPHCKDVKKPCACKICGEIGHTHEEHKSGCPHCEENHPAEECPTSQVTCFLV